MAPLPPNVMARPQPNGRGASRVCRGRYVDPVPGMAKNRRRANAPGRADELADIVLPDHEGTEVRLGDLWRDRPAALVFLRHWG